MSSPYGTATAGAARRPPRPLGSGSGYGTSSGAKRAMIDAFADDLAAGPQRQDQRVAVHAMAFDRQRAAGREKDELGVRRSARRTEDTKVTKDTKARRK